MRLCRKMSRRQLLKRENKEKNKENKNIKTTTKITWTSDVQVIFGLGMRVMLCH